MTISFVNISANNTSATATATATVTSSALEGAGHTNLVAVFWFNYATTPTLADTELNTYTQVGSTLTWETPQGSYAALFVASGIAGDSTVANVVTATWAGAPTATFIYLKLVEYSGVNTSTPTYSPNSFGSASTASPVLVSLTPTSTSDWMVAAGSYPDNDDTTGVSGGTQRGGIAGGDLGWVDHTGVTGANNIGFTESSVEGAGVIGCVLSAASVSVPIMLPTDAIFFGMT